LKEGTRLQLQRRFHQTAPIWDLRQIGNIYPRIKQSNYQTAYRVVVVFNTLVGHFVDGHDKNYERCQVEHCSPEEKTKRENVNTISLIIMAYYKMGIVCLYCDKKISNILKI
jgi:hypothetical protein